MFSTSTSSVVSFSSLFPIKTFSSPQFLPSSQFCPFQDFVGPYIFYSQVLLLPAHFCMAPFGFRCLSPDAKWSSIYVPFSVHSQTVITSVRWPIIYLSWVWSRCRWHRPYPLAQWNQEHEIRHSNASTDNYINNTRFFQAPIQCHWLLLSISVYIVYDNVDGSRSLSPVFPCSFSSIDPTYADYTDFPYLSRILLLLPRPLHFSELHSNILNTIFTILSCLPCAS